MRCAKCSYIYDHRKAHRCPKCKAEPVGQEKASQPDLLAATVKPPKHVGDFLADAAKIITAHPEVKDMMKKPIEPGPPPSREQWLEARRAHPCASEIAAILGMSTFRSGTPWRVQRDKLEGRPEKNETTEEMEMGNALEPFTGTLYTRKTGIALRPWPKHTICVHPDGWGACTPDFIPEDPALRFDVDGKVQGEYNAWKWGEEYSDEIPADYQLQGVWSMWVRDLEEWHISAIIGMKHRIFVLKRDREVETEVVGLVREWWDKHIVRRVPVPVDGSDAASEYLQTRFAKGRKVTMIATGEAEELMTVLRDAKEWDNRAAVAKNRLKEIMGESTLMTGAVGRVSWSAGGESDPKAVLDEKAYVAALEAALGDKAAALKEQHTETKTHPVSRRFLFTPAKE